MAAQRIGGGNWPKARDVFAVFVAMGCEIRTIPAGLLNEEAGEETLRILYNPAAKVFVDIQEYEDDMTLTPSEIDHFERRLDIEIPKPENWKFR
jgi:hypothetical protein